MKLLGRALPSGPASVSSAKAIDYTDTKTGVKVATQSAVKPFNHHGALPVNSRRLARCNRIFIDIHVAQRSGTRS